MTDEGDSARDENQDGEDDPCDGRCGAVVRLSIHQGVELGLRHGAGRVQLINNLLLVVEDAFR
ncbi:MAG: hypothetical protein KDB26_08170 [Microthrixaceae bacterium]|nr:hypothetical protein [Microthrixaceae bacterium]